MTLAEAAHEAAVAPVEADRRKRILEAAKRAFVREGFHATSMQHVAAEAGMSPGNLYRYFRSKEAIVEGLVAVDQVERAKAFADLMGAKSMLCGMAIGLREKLLREPREEVQMVLEIWAEAGRNPAIAKICYAIEPSIRLGLSKLFEAAKAKGEASARLDPDFGARLIITLVCGLYKRRAHEPEFDGEAEVALVLGTIKALFDGAIAPYRPEAG